MEAVRGWVWIFSGIAHLEPDDYQSNYVNNDSCHKYGISVIEMLQMSGISPTKRPKQ